MIKVSIIVPVYNVEKYIKRCLDSLISQTLDSIEIIVVNDGSTDNSGVIAENYAEKYPDSIKVYNKKNGGLSDARNFGMNYVHGEYVAFLDSDDYVDSTMLQKLYCAAISENKKLVVCGYIKEWENKKKEVIIEKGYTSIGDYIAYGETVAWNKLYSTAWLRNCGITFPKGLRYEDMEFFPCLLPSIESIQEVSFVKEPLVHYTQRADSISYEETDKVTDIWKIAENTINYFRKNNVSVEYYNAMEAKFTKAMFGSFLLKYNRISNKGLRKKLQKEHWLYIKNTFPYYKNNKYINKLDFKYLIYLKAMCKPLYMIMCNVPVK